MTTTQTAGQVLAAELCKTVRVSPNTRKNATSIKRGMLDAIRNAVQYPGYYSERRTEVFRAAFAAVASYDKHVDGYRIDGELRYRITSLSPYRFAKLLGEMVDAGVTNTGEGERFFAEMARERVAV